MGSQSSKLASTITKHAASIYKLPMCLHLCATNLPIHTRKPNSFCTTASYPKRQPHTRPSLPELLKHVQLLLTGSRHAAAGIWEESPVEKYTVYLCCQPQLSINVDTIVIHNGYRYTAPFRVNMQRKRTTYNMYG